jgi:hypothetical protein
VAGGEVEVVPCSDDAIRIVIAGNSGHFPWIEAVAFKVAIDERTVAAGRHAFIVMRLRGTAITVVVTMTCRTRYNIGYEEREPNPKMFHLETLIKLVGNRELINQHTVCTCTLKDVRTCRIAGPAFELYIYKCTEPPPFLELKHEEIT